MSKIKLMIEVEDDNELDWVVNRGCIMADRLRNAKRIEESDDCISRKAMLDALNEIDDGDGHVDIFICEVREIVMEVPSVNPKSDVLDKIRAEIEQIEISGHIRDVECFNAGIRHALTVIDKYKSEMLK